jgi:hypothetical protein
LSAAAAQVEITYITGVAAVLEVLDQMKVTLQIMQQESFIPVLSERGESLQLQVVATLTFQEILVL